LPPVHAIAELAQAEQSEVVVSPVGEKLAFGPSHLIPKPFGPRLT
jgi:malate dehydrogenase (oxaloacetate-decarboxylating)(NADP+)